MHHRNERKRSLKKQTKGVCRKTGFPRNLTLRVAGSTPGNRKVAALQAGRRTLACLTVAPPFSSPTASAAARPAPPVRKPAPATGRQGTKPRRTHPHRTYPTGGLGASPSGQRTCCFGNLGRTGVCARLQVANKPRRKPTRLTLPPSGPTCILRTWFDSTRFPTKRLAAVSRRYSD